MTYAVFSARLKSRELKWDNEMFPTFIKDQLQ